MKKFFKKKIIRIPYLILLYAFAIYGFFLTGTYFAMKFKLTNHKGSIDKNNRYFQEMSDKYNQSFKIDSASMLKHKYEVLNRIILLNDFYPTNAQYIQSIYESNKDERIALQMLDAIDLQLIDNKKYQKAKNKLKERNASGEATALSAYQWMNIAEWQDFKIAVAKDKKYIDSVAKVTGVEGRLIVACLVGEQIRLFNSSRESYKRYIGPLKVLALEANLSYGVTGIKESTAIKIENYLRDKNSKYYLGDEYAHLLDYDTLKSYHNDVNDTMSVRLKRLVQFKNHYYSYLYTAVFLKQMRTQWMNAGFPIDDRPEILASLFNLGFQRSIPKKNPSVGGSNYMIHDKEYTFGSVAYEFYYSGELADIFPYESKRFDWNKS